MKRIFLFITLFAVAAAAFAQEPHGKAAKKTAQKASKPTDPKVVEVLKEIEERIDNA